MNTLENKENMETTGLGRCQACGAERPGRDRFCRRCGASQRLEIDSAAGVGGATEWPVRDTRPLSMEKQYVSLSGALVNLVTESMSTRTSPLYSSPACARWTMRMAGALVAVPLWLMIVLLSPLDAYVAARAIARRA